MLLLLTGTGKNELVSSAQKRESTPYPYAAHWRLLVRGAGRWSWIALLLLVYGCSSPRVDHVPIGTRNAYDLVVFFDGTANNEGSHTNISKLYNLVTLRDRRDTRATYIQGVGTGSKVIGMAMGWGVGNDVRDAYSFLLDNYAGDRADRVSIFGFSRGAYAARILAALLHVAGIPDSGPIPPSERKEFVKEVYRAYKGKKTMQERRSMVAEVFTKYLGDAQTPISVRVRFLGLWDTVEALGWPDYQENINEPNTRYADQLCNIEFAAHALSIDDDRARIFTPLLLTRKHLREECTDDDILDPANVREVWFSGAHSDVGGGYGDTAIEGVSLNWMLEHIRNRAPELVSSDAAVYEDHLGRTHDPESGLFGLIYRKRNRDLVAYSETAGSNAECPTSGLGRFDVDFPCTATPESRVLTVHQSVLDRLCTVRPQPFESAWYQTGRFRNCVKCDNGRGSIIADCNSIVAVGARHREAPLSNTCELTACPSAYGADYVHSQSCNLAHPWMHEWAAQGVRGPAKPNGASEVVYFPDRDRSATGVLLEAGRKYRFEIVETDHWVDCTLPASPVYGRPFFDVGHPFTSAGGILLSIFAIRPFSPYMQIVGEVAGRDIDLAAVIAEDRTFIPSLDGELVLRVNEPRFSRTFFANNFGALRLRVTDVTLSH